MKFINKRILTQRKERGLSREDLAFQFRKLNAKVSPRTILNWEKGKSDPDANDIAILCHIFGSPVTYFFAKS